MSPFGDFREQPIQCNGHAEATSKSVVAQGNYFEKDWYLK